MSKILVAGLAVIDMLFEVEHLPRRPEKHVARNARIVGGGGAANAAVALSRLKAQPLLLARIGGDSLGQIIYDELHACGVDCTLVQMSDSGRSSFSSVLIDQTGERQIVNFRGHGLVEAVPSVDHIKVDAVLADTRWSEATMAVLAHARTSGVPGVLDAEAPVTEEAVRLASHVAFSAQGLRSFSGIANLAEAVLQVARSVEGFVCVTDGGNGVLYVSDGKVHKSPACEVNAVDTLGAGDVWHAAFVCRLADGDNEGEAIRFANAAAAIKCTRRGGGRESPTLDDVEYFIRERGLL